MNVLQCGRLFIAPGFLSIDKKRHIAACDHLSIGKERLVDGLLLPIVEREVSVGFKGG